MDEWIETNQIVSFLFEAFDEKWKGGDARSSPSAVEKNWGVYNEGRTPKESFADYLSLKDISSN